MTLQYSFTGKIWNDEYEQGNAMSFVAKLLKKRGIDPRSPVPLSGPEIYPDMRRAVDRIKLAIDRKQNIGIFGDYDCDGITATAQLVRYFQRHGCTPFVRLPHRIHDGYGLSPSIVEEMIKEEVDLLITVDTGITAKDEVAALQDAGIDVIITDHHHLADELPLAYAMLHPLLAPHYPQPYPAGAGVAFHLLRGLEGENWDGMHTDLALAMIGTIADLVDVKGENRTLIQSGLESLRLLKDEPLATLRDSVSSGSATLKSSDIAFRIAPRINAAGRMAEPQIALKAILDGGDALEQLDALNAERQLTTEELMSQVSGLIDRDNLPPILALADESFPHGIIGLIAGRLTEQTGHPSLVASVDGDVCTASLRSTEKYNIAEGLKRVSDLLITHGGHAQAAGCTFKRSHFEDLTNKLNEDIRKNVTEELMPQIVLSGSLNLSDITMTLCNQISLLEPFGQGNAEPVFIISNITIENTRRVGAEGRHLQGKIGMIKLIGFGLGYLESMINDPVDIAVRIGIDQWQGMMQPQLIIEDIRLAIKDRQLAVGN